MNLLVRPVTQVAYKYVGSFYSMLLCHVAYSCYLCDAQCCIVVGRMIHALQYAKITS